MKNFRFSSLLIAGFGIVITLSIITNIAVVYEMNKVKNNTDMILAIRLQ